MELNEIEDKMENNEMTAGQVFTQMMKHIPSDKQETSYFYNYNAYKPEGGNTFHCGTFNLADDKDPFDWILKKAKKENIGLTVNIKTLNPI